MMYEKYMEVYKIETSIYKKNNRIGCYSNCSCVVNSIGIGIYSSYKIQDSQFFLKIVRLYKKIIYLL
jgi:hypothetical protein